MATIKINGPRKNRVCQTIIGKRQLRANAPIRLLALLLADVLTEVSREVIHSLSIGQHVYIKDNIWLPERYMYIHKLWVVPWVARKAPCVSLVSSIKRGPANDRAPEFHKSDVMRFYTLTSNRSSLPVTAEPECRDSEYDLR